MCNLSERVRPAQLRDRLHRLGRRPARRTRLHADYPRIVVAYDSEMGFYESCGFEKATGSSPMFITDLWT